MLSTSLCSIGQLTTSQRRRQPTSDCYPDDTGAQSSVTSSSRDPFMTAPSRCLMGLTLAATVLTAPVLAQQRPGPADPAKATTIRHLLDLTGAARLALSGMEAMVPAQRAANPQIPGAFWDAFLARARRSLPQLVDAIVPVYASHFSQAELEQLVRFYESPLGKHLSEVQPLILQESMQAGQAWGAAIGREVGESLSRSGVKPPNPN